MFRFGSPDMFFLLLLVPVLVALYVFAMRARSRRIRRFGDPATVAALMPDASPRRVRNKFVMLLCAMVLIIVALARPQFGSKLKEQQQTGIELIFIVDVSNSMLAQDFEPSRLELTKMSINRLMGELSQDRVGLIVFAGEPYVQLPITSDYTTARNFIAQASPDMVSKQGTAIGAAIELAVNSFSSQGEASRVMVVISDGENHEDDAVVAARAAAEKGIVIHTIGIGTPEGTAIQIGGDLLKDGEGNPVVTKLDELVLQQVALNTGGAYVRATKQNIGLQEIVQQIRHAEKGRFTSTVFEEYNERFQYLLAAALLLLLIDALMMTRRNQMLARFNIFGRDKRQEK